MLLYVNKKQERLKKIKLFTTIFAIIFIITANIYHLIINIHQTDSTLLDYTPIKHSSSSQDDTSSVTLYQTSSSKTYAILIPSTLTKTNTKTIIKGFSSPYLTPSASLFFTPEIKDIDFLQNIALSLNLQISSKQTPASIIITTDINQIPPLIYKQKLYPKTLIQPSKLPSHLISVLDKKFPPRPLPSNKLEEEKFSLQSFAKDYSLELKSLINNTAITKQPFKKQDALLKNISLCIKTAQNIYCDTSPKTSVAKKISDIISIIPQSSQIQKLILLTSFEETTEQSFNLSNGLLLRFEQRQSLLLPEEITSAPFQTIKQKLGINPKHTNKLMKFYQFKTVEIPLL